MSRTPAFSAQAYCMQTRESSIGVEDGIWTYVWDPIKGRVNIAQEVSRKEEWDKSLVTRWSVKQIYHLPGKAFTVEGGVSTAGLGRTAGAGGTASAGDTALGQNTEHGGSEQTS